MQAPPLMSSTAVLLKLYSLSILKHTSCATSIHSNNMSMVFIQRGKEQRLLTCRTMHCEKSDGTGEVTLCPVQPTSKY